MSAWPTAQASDWKNKSCSFDYALSNYRLGLYPEGASLETGGHRAYLSPLVHGATHRVGRLRGYGNAINPYVAAAFIRAYLGDE